MKASSIPTYSMKFDLRCWTAVVIAAVCLSACARTQDPPVESTPAQITAGDSLARTAATLHLDSLRHAFRQLRAYAFTRRVETTQVGPGGNILARTVHLLRYEVPGQQRASEVQTLASTGSFDFGLFGRRAETPGLGENVAAIADGLIPTDPPYLSARNRDNFIYRSGPDTLIAGMPAAVLIIRAAPDAHEQRTRLARLYFDPQSRNVVALYLEQENPVFLFREHTTSYAQAIIDRSGAWLPDTTSVDTRVHLPLTATRRFRTASRFSDFAFSPSAPR